MNKLKRKTYAFLFCLLLCCTLGAQNGIQTGDLLFVSLPINYNLSDTTWLTKSMNELNAGKTTANIIHVAILEVDNDGVWIIDATLKHGVARYPLDTFLTDFTLPNGMLPRFDIMRLKKDKNAALYVLQAKKFVGREYDVDFQSDNQAQYCSELVYNAYISPQGKHLFKEGIIDFSCADGNTPLYWEQLFALIGKKIPNGNRGTLPQTMMKSSRLKRVGIRL
ncbi:MAG: hypothetical protein MJZ70_05020 [Bacteroidales bacterium]|nr:hypothetical protein [Bacteroidales bacterium]